MSVVTLFIKGLLDLAGINKKVLSENEALPVVRLKDNTLVQTGTVAVMLHNQGEWDKIEDELILAIPI